MCIRDRRIDEASHAVIGVAGDRSVRRGFGNHAAQRVVGPGGYIAPVSYTHLDVYKRQLRDHADVVIAAFHRLPVAHVLDEQAAGLIIGVARYVFQRVRHLGQLVHTTASILI